MALITDFFGKASVDTDHSVATTVTADRIAGVMVLTCYDLSTYTEDTPIYFVTYTKTTDPVTGAVTITDTTSWKGLVNAGANTITNMVAAPGYTDNGNTDGQFVECIPTSYWVNSLIDGILTSLNPDGTLKDGAVSTASILGANVVETAKIKDENVTRAKLAVDTRPGLRPYTTTSTATLSPNVDNYTSYEVTAQAAALTIANPTGTATDKTIIMFFIKDNGTPRAITWGTSFSNISGLDTLATTVANKWSVVGCVYNASVSKWQIVSISTEA